MITVLVLGCVVACAGLAWHRRSNAKSSEQFDGIDRGTTVMVANPLFMTKSRRKKKILPRVPTPADAEMAAAAAAPTYGALDSSQKWYATGGHHARNDDSSYAQLGESTPAEAEIEAAAAASTYGVLDSSQQYATVGHHHPRNDDCSYARLDKKTPAEAEIQAAAAASENTSIEAEKEAAASSTYAYARPARYGVPATAELDCEVADDGPDYVAQHTYVGGSGPQRGITAAVKPKSKLSREDSMC